MGYMIFKAYAIASEIDLNKIAVKCGIPKKYTWEEPLILQDKVLSSILQRQVSEKQKVLVFFFGSIVFVNATPNDMEKFWQYFKTFKPEIDLNHLNMYSDDYEMRVGTDPEIELTDEYIIVPNYDALYPEVISTVIAKSVALEKTEEQLEKILDKLEGMLDRLEKGRMQLGYKKLAATIAKIVRHKYNTITYIMILDKPNITWTSILADELHHRMSEFFELNARFVIMKEKTDILTSIMEGFSSISFTMREFFLEWVIIILIAAELIIKVLEFLKQEMVIDDKIAY